MPPIDVHNCCSGPLSCPQYEFQSATWLTGNEVRNFRVSLRILPPVDPLLSAKATLFASRLLSGSILLRKFFLVVVSI